MLMCTFFTKAKQMACVFVAAGGFFCSILFMQTAWHEEYVLHHHFLTSKMHETLNCSPKNDKFQL